MSEDKNMRCLRKTEGVEGYELTEQPVPELAPHEVLIKVDKVGICGSDISLWKWNEVAKGIATLPFIPGHEATGLVVAVGSQVEGTLMGKRVAVENHFYCGDCSLCKENRGDICLRMNQYGHGRGTDQGGCSQYSAVPAHFCYVLTRHLSPEQAVLLEPMGVAHNAVSEIDVGGKQVLVLGCGPVGLLAVAICKALEAKAIVAVDIVPSRLELAKKMGATHFINSSEDNIMERVMELTNGDGIERIVEASGSAALLNRSFKWLRKGGQMVLIGIPKDPLHVDNVLKDIQQKSLTFKSVHGRRIFSTWRACESLIASGRIDVTPLVTHQFPLTRFQEAFQLLLSGQSCKILLDPQS